MGCNNSKVKETHHQDRQQQQKQPGNALQQKQNPSPLKVDDSFREIRSSTIDELSSNPSNFNALSFNIKNSFHLSIKSSNYQESNSVGVNNSLQYLNNQNQNGLNPRLHESLNSTNSNYVSSSDCKKTFSQMTNNSIDSLSTTSQQLNSKLNYWKNSINKYIQNNQQKQVYSKPLDVLLTAIDICEKHFQGEVHPVQLASLALSESKGENTLEKFDDDIQQIRYGLCQMTHKVAKQLQQQYGLQYYINTSRSQELFKPENSLMLGALALKNILEQIKNYKESTFLDTHQFSEIFEKTAILLYHKQQFKIFEVVKAMYDDVQQQIHFDTFIDADNFSEKENIKQQLFQSRSSQEIMELKKKESSTQSDARFLQTYFQNKQHLYNLWEAVKRSPCNLDSQQMHIVQERESLVSIAKACEVSVEQLIGCNKDVDMGALQPGDCIALPVNKVLPRIHIVQRHQQSLFEIARNYEVSYRKLRKVNPGLVENNSLRPGVMVTIPGLQSYVSPSDTISSFSSSNQSRNVIVPHSVKRGETLNQIARTYNVTLKDLIRANRSVVSSDLQVKRGDLILIPLK